MSRAWCRLLGWFRCWRWPSGRVCVGWLTSGLACRVIGAANAGLKVASLVAGMVAGADSIDDLALLRHGGMGRLFQAIYAPSTLGSFLREFRFGHVRQLDAVAARVTANLTRCAPLLPGADQVAYVDVDDTVKQTYGYAKQGVGYGYTGVKGLNALLAIVSTPLAAPVVVASPIAPGSGAFWAGCGPAGG
jgi:hypothetical protein